MRSSPLKILLLSLVLIGINNQAHAWGERGHDLITRVAVQHMRNINNDNLALMRPFLLRDHMLAHLSNTPDTVWRADYMGEEVIKTNSPTHYINLEKVATGVEKWNDLPRSFREYRALCQSKGHDTTDVGTAPWRVLQLYTLIVDQLTNLDAKPDELKEQHINQALLYSGLMSHFVGDLANPHHTTANYDGQLTGNKGLHAYFESVVVAELSFELPEKMLKKAGSRGLWLRTYGAKERAEILADPQKLIWALMADSHTHVEKLIKLDDRHSIVAKSIVDADSGEQASAKRKPAKEVSRRYEKFAVERLAVGADALARLWQLAWVEAGSPDMSQFRSYHYPVQPPFITPVYESE